MQNGLYIGLMSGTSLDGIDAALVEFSEEGETVRAFHYTPWPTRLRERLRELSTPGDNEIDRLGELDIESADAFADAVASLLSRASTSPSLILAIGSHGQTIRHRPQADYPFTLQIGDPNRLAEKTGIRVVADFRRRDMAAGGEGAPLAPAYHAARFRTSRETRAVLNIGGIANVTLLPKAHEDSVVGFDTGPGNTLLNAWIQKQLGLGYDDKGRWAAEGRVSHELLESMLSDPYFAQPVPKSTGPEHFNLRWLQQHLAPNRHLSPQDVQATLTRLTSESIARAIHSLGVETGSLIVCGGGTHNPLLLQQLRSLLPGVRVESSAALGVDPDQLEAIAFAWLARQTLSGVSGNLPQVTGARHPVVLGGIYSA
ncbi:MAG: anhydro-N-acetylmuramic acid kinase [Gammaproteobacteria bacterium]|nr:anhydro-N-acetylmuramic acid kinase [Gammaproteobacteria bacterium]